MASTQDPGELHEGRDGQRELYRLVNWLRRRVGGTSTDADYWTSSDQTAILPSSVSIGALAAPGGILKANIAAGVATPALAVAGTDYVQSVTVTAPITNTGTPAAPNIAHAASGVTAASYSYAAISVNATGHVTAAANGITPGPVDATYITQIPNATLTNEQALSTLSSGVLSSVTATGVVSSTAFTAGRIAYGSGVDGTLTQDADLTWGAATGLVVDNGVSAKGITVQGSQPFTGVNMWIKNTSAGNAAFASTVYIGDGANRADVYFTSSTYATSDSLPSSLTFGATASVIFSPAYVRCLRLTTPHAYLESGNLFLILAGNQSIEKQTSGNLNIGTSTATSLNFYTNATTWATLTSAGEFGLLTSAVETWYNSEGANYERVRAFWSANVWNLKSEKNGGGTVRAMKIDSDTANLTFNSAVLTATCTQLLVTASSTSLNSAIAGTTSTSLTIGDWNVISLTAAGTTPSITASTADAVATISTGTHAIDLNSAPTIASAGGATLDAIRLRGGVSITGTTTITGPFALVTVAGTTFNQSGAGSVTVDFPISFYVAAAPQAGTDVTFTQAYGSWIEGLAKFTGNGARVFELPADATTAGSHIGRIPVLIGGSTRYLHYYDG